MTLDEWHKIYWTPERYAQHLRLARGMGIRVHEPSTLPHLPDEELAAIVAKQPSPPKPLEETWNGQQG